jgi:transposase
MIYFQILRKNMSKTGCGKHYEKQSKEIILRVVEWLKNNHLKSIMITSPIPMAAEILKVGKRSIYDILKEQTSENGLKSPKKKRKRQLTKSSMNSFEESVIRRTIYDFHKEHKQVPNVKSLLPVLQDKINFSGKQTTLTLMIKKLGFRWKKTDDNRVLLKEKMDIVFKRINYLRAIKNYRRQGRPIVYSDETYIHSSHVSSNSWIDSTNKGLKVPASKGTRFIIVHAGTEKGFIPGAFLMFKSGTKSGDYHDDMNYTNYRRWAETQLIPNLEMNSVIVLDNASYHNKLDERTPNANNNKAQMKEWLTKRNIKFHEKALKAELYHLIKLHKPRQQSFRIDELFEKHGHTVLRLPPYHPELNPIEKIWAVLKRYVADNNVEFTIDSVKKLVEEKVSKIHHEWKNICDHVVKEEDIYMEDDGIIDLLFDNDISINLNDSSSSEEEEEEEEEEEC